MSAASNLNLKGLNSSPCPPISSTGCPYAGLLLWQDGNGSGNSAQSSDDIIIGAGANLSIAGTIYAPTGAVTLQGSTGVSGCTSGATEYLMLCSASERLSRTRTPGKGPGHAPAGPGPAIPSPR